MKPIVTYIASISELRTTLLYCLFAGLLTFISERLVDILAFNHVPSTAWQMYDDWLFVLIAAVVFYVLFRKQYRASVVLQLSEQRLKSTLDSMLEGCQIIGPDWRYLYVNEAAAKQGQQTKSALLGHTMMEMYPGIERTELFTALRRCKEEHSSHSLEKEFIFPDGSKSWFELVVQPVPEGILILSMDITQRKLAEKRIERQVGRLNALHEIDRVIVSSFNRRFSLDTLLEKMITQLQVDAADVLLLTQSTEFLEFASGRGFRTLGFEKVRLALGSSYVGKIVIDHQMLYASDLGSLGKPYPRKALMEAEGFVSYYGVPLIVKGIARGVLEVFHRREFKPDQEWLDFLETLAGQAAVVLENTQLFEDLQKSHSELRIAYDRTIEGWSRALDLRDRETEGHTQRVTQTTIELARTFGLSEEELIYVRWGALLHDIGKLGIPDHVLFKPNVLTDEERALMRKHPEFAHEMLSGISYLKSAVDIPYCHHEKWDGTGYPRGLKGKQIPLPARLFTIVDVWDALTSTRPYRLAWTEERAVQYIEHEAGSHFDPQVVKKFLEMIRSKSG